MQIFFWLSTIYVLLWRPLVLYCVGTYMATRTPGVVPPQPRCSLNLQHPIPPLWMRRYRVYRYMSPYGRATCAPAVIPILVLERVSPLTFPPIQTHNQTHTHPLSHPHHYHHPRNSGQLTYNRPNQGINPPWGPMTPGHSPSQLTSNAIG